MSIICYFAAFVTNSLTVISTAYCGHKKDIFEVPLDTAILLPEFARPLAKKCFYNRSSGDLSELMPT